MEYLRKHSSHALAFQGAPSNSEHLLATEMQVRPTHVTYSVTLSYWPSRKEGHCILSIVIIMVLSKSANVHFCFSIITLFSCLSKILINFLNTFKLKLRDGVTERNICWLTSRGIDTWDFHLGGKTFMSLPPLASPSSPPWIILKFYIAIGEF